jgi:hypothetical protein
LTKLNTSVARDSGDPKGLRTTAISYVGLKISPRINKIKYRKISCIYLQQSVTFQRLYCLHYQGIKKTEKFSEVLNVFSTETGPISRKDFVTTDLTARNEYSEDVTKLTYFLNVISRAISLLKHIQAQDTCFINTIIILATYEISAMCMVIHLDERFNPA